jgi:HD-like signal output (HDOD) protein
MSELLDDVCAAALSLPCSPRLLPDLTEVLASDDADVEDLARLIQLDPVLAASTLRLANSAFFSASVPVETVGEAVMRLGARELYRLAALSLVTRWGAIEAPGYGWEAGDFCRASLVKGVAVEALAKAVGRLDPSIAFTCGLVQDIGKLAIAFHCPERLEGVRSQVATTQCNWLEAESAVLGFNHTDVSSRLLEKWRFSPLCVAVARDPFAKSLQIPEEREMAAHLHAAQYLAAFIGVGQGEDAFLFTVDESLLLEHKLSPEIIEGLAPEIIDRVSHLLKDRMQVGAISV